MSYVIGALLRTQEVFPYARAYWHPKERDAIWHSKARVLL